MSKTLRHKKDRPTTAALIQDNGDGTAEVELVTVSDDRDRYGANEGDITTVELADWE